VARDIIRQLGMSRPRGYKGSFFRPNLHIYCRKKGEGETRREILALIRARQGDSGIVYCQSRRTVEQTAEYLQKHGVRARPYHAGLPDSERAGNQEAFARDDADVIVATIALGMGIDKSNVRFVIHRDMPKDIESWYQEIGRAGRDGLPSDCFLYFSWADVKLHERFLEDIQDERLKQAKRHATVSLFRMVEMAACRHKSILAYFGESIDNCGESCDICSGITAEALIGQGTMRGPSRAGTMAISEARSSVRTAASVVSTNALFEKLRSLRKELADRQNVPAYIVFSDATLRGMADLQPTTPAALLRVPGVGPAKLERYGEPFLSLIREFRTTARNASEPYI
jgi:ATP-dependent DNA helicase RecQ